MKLHSFAHVCGRRRREERAIKVTKNLVCINIHWKLQLWVMCNITSLDALHCIYWMDCLHVADASYSTYSWLITLHQIKSNEICSLHFIHSSNRAPANHMHIWNCCGGAASFPNYSFQYCPYPTTRLTHFYLILVTFLYFSFHYRMQWSWMHACIKTNRVCFYYPYCFLASGRDWHWITFNDNSTVFFFLLLSQRRQESLLLVLGEQVATTILKRRLSFET